MSALVDGLAAVVEALRNGAPEPLHVDAYGFVIENPGVMVHVRSEDFDAWLDVLGAGVVTRQSHSDKFDQVQWECADAPVTVFYLVVRAPVIA